MHVSARGVKPRSDISVLDSLCIIVVKSQRMCDVRLKPIKEKRVLHRIESRMKVLFKHLLIITWSSMIHVIS